MKVWVIYDSVYGNTEKIAQAIADAFKPQENPELVRASSVKPDQLRGSDLVIVGTPTQGFRPLESIRALLEHLPSEALKGTNVAAFDTRIAGKEAGAGARLVARVGGYAAGRMADTLKKKGGYLIVPPEGFAVNGSEGPLATGELQRAGQWAKKIVEAQNKKQH
jgi:flavodoxin